MFPHLDNTRNSIYDSPYDAIIFRMCAVSWAPFYYHGLTLILAWISDYIHYEMWDEITYPFLNFNGATVEV